MGRIPEAELERLKREVDLVALVEESGVKLHRQGKDWAGLCCWHEDHEPSLVVSPDKQLWHCLGCAPRKLLPALIDSEAGSSRGGVRLLGGRDGYRARLVELLPNGSAVC